MTQEIINYEEILKNIKENNLDVKSALRKCSMKSIIDIFNKNVVIDDYIWDFIYDQVVKQFEYDLEIGEFSNKEEEK